MKRGKKKFSYADKVKYHERRVNNPNVSEGKKAYSRSWLDGVHDTHAKSNYSAICHEIEYKKGRCSRIESIVLNGFKNGLKAKIDSKK